MEMFLILLVVGNKTAGVNVTVPEIIPDKTVSIANLISGIM